jgi:hypothetical protein
MSRVGALKKRVVTNARSIRPVPIITAGGPTSFLGALILRLPSFVKRELMKLPYVNGAFAVSFATMRGRYFPGREDLLPKDQRIGV